MQMVPSFQPSSHTHSQRAHFPTPQAAVKAAAILVCLVPSLFAAAPSTQSPPAASLDATALVRRAVQHRLDSERAPHPMQYLLHRADERHDTTKLIIETRDGDVARLIAIGGKPVGSDVNQAEFARLDTLAQHPEQQERRRKSEQKDEDRVTHLLSLIPDAYIYKMEGIVPCPSGQCYHLSFTPNPNFNPPDMESQILRATAGEVWIDQVQERLNKLDAHFISDADFGFGIIGRLNKGSVVTLEQNDVGGHDWELTGLRLHVTGRLLLVKSFSSQINETMTRFAPAPPGLTYRDAIQVLKKVDPAQPSYTP